MAKATCSPVAGMKGEEHIGHQRLRGEHGSAARRPAIADIVTVLLAPCAAMWLNHRNAGAGKPAGTSTSRPAPSMASGPDFRWISARCADRLDRANCRLLRVLLGRQAGAGYVPRPWFSSARATGGSDINSARKSSRPAVRPWRNATVGRRRTTTDRNDFMMVGGLQCELRHPPGGRL